MNSPIYQSFNYSYTPVSRKLITPAEAIGISSEKPGQKTTVRAALGYRGGMFRYKPGGLPDSGFNPYRYYSHSRCE